MIDQHVIKNALYREPIEVLVHDLAELEEVLALYLIDNGLIEPKGFDTAKKWKYKDPVNRLNFVFQFIDAYIYSKCIPRNINDLDYDNFTQDAQEAFRQAEIPHITADNPKLQDVFSSMERDIINALPLKLCKRTWHLWSLKLISRSILYSNIGDYRILYFAHSVHTDKDNPLHGKLPMGVLYRHGSEQ